MSPRLLTALVAAIIGAGSIGACSPSSDELAPPRVMAALGDSITRAFNVDECCLLQDAPQYSWSTGTEVDSHLMRLRQRFPGAEITSNNFAVSGARASDVPAQMGKALSANADYVTLAIGANDVCATTAPTRDQFINPIRSALASFSRAQPSGQLLLTSIPDVLALRSTLQSNERALAIWATFGICRSALSPAATSEQREQTQQRLTAFNTALKETCKEFPQCNWDENAVATTPFSAADVSAIDFFHPSIKGQQLIAAVTWSHTPWGKPSSNE